MPLFLHAGESLSPANTNIQTAYLLGSLRISHGLNLFYFNQLEEDLKGAGTVLEVCPISNQSLGYVSDLRLHPARQYLSHGLKAALGSDDPAIFGSRGLTDDLWMAYVAWHLNLRALKRLAMTSISVSGLQPAKIARHRRIFRRRWSAFINDTIRSAVRGNPPRKGSP